MLLWWGSLRSTHPTGLMFSISVLASGEDTFDDAEVADLLAAEMQFTPLKHFRGQKSVFHEERYVEILEKTRSS